MIAAIVSAIIVRDSPIGSSAYVLRVLETIARSMKTKSDLLADNGNAGLGSFLFGHRGS